MSRELSKEPRLPHAGLCDDLDEPASACAGLLERAEKDLQLPVAPDERKPAPPLLVLLGGLDPAEPHGSNGGLLALDSERLEHRGLEAGRRSLEAGRVVTSTRSGRS